MNRAPIGLAALALSALVVMPASASHGIRIYCDDPEAGDLRHYDEVFVAELYSVHLLKAPKGRWLGPRSSDYRYRLGVVTRYKGKARGVVDLFISLNRSPLDREGERYLFFVDRDEKGALQSGVCQVSPVEEVAGLLRSLEPRGKDLQYFLRKVRKERADRLAEAKARKEEFERWERRVRLRLVEEAGLLRAAIAKDDAERAYELWEHRRQLETTLLVAPDEERVRLQRGFEVPSSEESKALETELLPFLLKAAARAHVAREFRQARRNWLHALQVDRESAQARQGLSALDAEAKAVLEAAERHRKTDPALSRAGLREVLRLSSVSSELHTRALRLLEALPK